MKSFSCSTVHFLLYRIYICTENAQNLYLEKWTDLLNVGTFLFSFLIFSGNVWGHKSKFENIFLVWKSKMAMKFACINEENKLRESYENT